MGRILIAPTSGVAASTVDLLTGISIPSSATVNLDTATGNRVHITGTTAITAITLTRGPRIVIFDGILLLTYNSVTNKLSGGLSITTAVGDICEYHSDGTIVYGVYTKVDGTPIKNSKLYTFFLSGG
jgi:hypothetical protein